MGTTFDASTTNLTYEIPSPFSSADSKTPLEVVISFLSPITPTSTLRQSIPASYMTVHVSGDFDIDIYVDVNGQWVSGDRASEIVWEFSQQELAEGKGLKSWKIRRETEQLLSEWRDQAEWGTLHFSAPSVRYCLEFSVEEPRLTILGCSPRVWCLGSAAASVCPDRHIAEYRR